MEFYNWSDGTGQLWFNSYQAVTSIHSSLWTKTSTCTSQKLTVKCAVIHRICSSTYINWFV